MMEMEPQSPSEPLLSSSGENSSSSTTTTSDSGGAARGGGTSAEGPVPPTGRGAAGGGSTSGGAASTGGGGSAAAAAAGSTGGRGSPSEDIWCCNICLDQVNEPVVTMCGHLFCWPCLYRWLNSNHNMCPVCKAGVAKDNVIPLYGRGTEQVDPRTKPRSDDDIPGRPAAQRPEARPQTQTPQGFVGGIPVINAFGGNQMMGNGMSFSAGFGFFPSLFGLQFQTFSSTSSNMPLGPGVHNNVSPDEAQQAFLSRLLLMLGIFVIMCLLMF